MSINDLIAKAKELEDLQRVIAEKIEVALAKSVAVDAIKAQMQAAGVTIEDLGYGSIKPATAKPATIKASTSRKGQRIEPKYRGPNGETWSARGLKPRWLKAALAGGATLEQFKIAA